MACWKANAQKEFDAWSRSYDQSILQRWFFAPSHEQLIRESAWPAAGQVLDVGCGTGNLVVKLLRRQPRLSIVGLDLSESMLKRAKDNCGDDATDRLQLVLGDSENLPFVDDTFDAVTCVHSFHHYPNQEAVVKEIHRVLKPGGQFLLVDANRDGWWGWMLFDGIVATIERKVHHCSAKRLRGLFDQAGFTSVRQKVGGYWAPTLLTVGVADKSASPMERRDFAMAA